MYSKNILHFSKVHPWSPHEKFHIYHDILDEIKNLAPQENCTLLWMGICLFFWLHLTGVGEELSLIFYPWHSPTPYSCCWVGTFSSPVQTGSFERLLQNRARKTCMMKSPPQSISSSLGHFINVLRCFRHILQGIWRNQKHRNLLT